MFQSTRPQGARHMLLSLYLFNLWFQSTRPQGARRWSPCQAWHRCPGFNPRARRGRDQQDLKEWIYSCVSIHAPAGGATMAALGMKSADVVSIHAPAGGATAWGSANRNPYTVSIHAPAGGATRLRGRVRRGGMVSIHAPAGGATWVSLSIPRRSMFQSTRPQGARPSSCKDRNRLSENGILRQPMSVGSQIDDPERRPFNISRFIN